jgi:Tol biopolymer transport system component
MRRFVSVVLLAAAACAPNDSSSAGEKTPPTVSAQAVPDAAADSAAIRATLDGWYVAMQKADSAGTLAPLTPQFLLLEDTLPLSGPELVARLKQGGTETTWKADFSACARAPRQRGGPLKNHETSQEGREGVRPTPGDHVSCATAGAGSSSLPRSGAASLELRVRPLHAPGAGMSAAIRRLSLPWSDHGTRRPRPTVLTAALPAGVASATLAQRPPAAPAHRAGVARSSPRPLVFTTDEGTLLDLSPTGEIVFDLLGDLYTSPATGGAATRITSGSGFDGQPRWAPDGNAIVFVSDRSGSENLYVVGPDGKNLRAVTSGRGMAYVSPDWTPDGQYIVVSRSNDLWLYHRNGGSGLRLTGAAPVREGAGPGGGNAPANFMGASVSPDGRYVYASARTGPAGYNQMMGTTQVVMYDRETGRLATRTLNLGTGFRPAVSPDGKWLAYASRQMAVTGLKLRELSSGDERWLAKDIQRDDIESRGSRDLLPGYSWTPDSKAIVLAHHGKIWRLDVATGQQSPIPFTAEVNQMIGELVAFQYPVNDSVLTVRQVRGARPSPDGKRLAFSALDHLWIMDLPAGTPRRLTTSTDGEHVPAWSPDGKYIAYVSWTEDGGDIWRIAADGGRPEKLTTQSAYYDDIMYSANGTRIVAARAPHAARSSTTIN